MAARASLDDKLAALRSLRGQALTPEQREEVRKRIGNRSNLVVAAAANLAGENTLADLAGDLEAAFDRFLVDPIRDDKLCRAKIAIVEALDKMEHLRTDVFLKAARHVQFEPVWAGTEDSAPPLRGAALIALARIEGPGCVALLTDAMADPAKDVRIAAALALGAVGSDAAALVLRLKVRIGDKDPDVLSECLGALLTTNPGEGLGIVAEHLDPLRPATCEAAALALGKSRLAEALGPLVRCWERPHQAELGRQILLSIAMLRRPAAIEYLKGLVATGAEPTAIAALAALAIHKHDPRLREQVAGLVRERGSPPIQARFDHDFRPVD